ncbi:MAG: hypothetical protein N2111_01215 [Candidatus Sumerlaeaceae bacterium]|nr:hypothetical protein [Candidatus Sumerlaeaceae bacterium]
MSPQNIVALICVPLVILAVVLGYGFALDAVAWGLVALSLALLGWAWFTSRSR